MSFRNKLLVIFLLSIGTAVTVVAWGVTRYTRRAFEDLDSQRTEALVAQFRKELAQRGDEVVRRVAGIADAEATTKMALALAQSNGDASLYVRDAMGLAQEHQLDFVELVANDGTLVSSAQYPARVGYKNDWVTLEKDWKSQGAFLRREDLPDSVALSLAAVRTAMTVGDKTLYIVGGLRLDQNFLASLSLPEGTRAFLYRNLEPAFVASAVAEPTGGVSEPERFAPIIEEVQKKKQPVARTIQWTSDPASTETFHALPLAGRNGDLLGVLLVGSSRRELINLTNFIRLIALVVGAAGLLLGFLLSWWVSARVTRPVERLAEGARAVATGEWHTRIDVTSADEIGQAATAFNDMTRQLAGQQERLRQSERVAAWRELARRLAHELRNPLFPLQITVDNLQRARALPKEQFDEIFAESTKTLRAELENLHTIVGRFNDFSKMPTPQWQKVNLNELVRNALRLFEAQFTAIGKPPVTPELFLDENLPEIQADPDLLQRALQNLVLNALDAMPAGGTLTVRTSPREGGVRLEVSDTGSGLTAEECERLFTPYYTTKRHGTGLGLAIVQSVVSDHGGTITVSSEAGRGTSFRIDLPVRPQSTVAAPLPLSNFAKVAVAG